MNTTRKRRPVALWALFAWTVLCVIWLIAGVGGTDCSGQTGDRFLSAHDAQSACETGAGLAGVAILGFWAFGLFVIAAIMLVVRFSRR